MIDNQQAISSDQNPKFKLWKSLLTSKSRKKESLFILSGEKIIADFIKDGGANRFPVKAVLTSKNISVEPLVRVWPRLDSKLLFTLESLLFKELDVLGTDYPVLICQKPNDIVVETLPAPAGLELGLPLTDPANLGALCRTALSFNVSKAVLTTGACDPFHPKAIRASSGATLKMDFIHHKPSTTTDSQNSNGDSDYCLDLQGQSIYNFQWPKNIRLWLGEEGQGFKRTFQTKNKINIPINGMESLNATVAGSIAIFSYSQRFNKF